MTGAQAERQFEGRRRPNHRAKARRGKPISSVLASLAVSARSQQRGGSRGGYCSPFLLLAIIALVLAGVVIWWYPHYNYYYNNYRREVHYFDFNNDEGGRGHGEEAATATLTAAGTIRKDPGSHPGQQRRTRNSTAADAAGNRMVLPVPPLWPSCRANDGTNDESFGCDSRLIFVHVFKTAGTSFRELFLGDVAVECGRGVAEVTGCSQVDHESLLRQLRYRGSTGGSRRRALRSAGEGAGGGTSRYDGPCYAPRTRGARGNRSSSSAARTAVHGPRPLTAAWLDRLGVDIVVGHLPIGLHEYLDDDAAAAAAAAAAATNSSAAVGGDSRGRSQRRTQYVTFFRDPVTKYVSGRLYLNSHRWRTADEALSAIRSTVEKASDRREHYNSYVRYLTTPAQKARQANEATSDEMKVEQIRSNMIRHGVLVGLVERMGDSIALLQSVIDADRKLTPLLLRMVARDDGSNSSGGTNQLSPLVANPSRLSTTGIVRRLRQDPSLDAKLREYLKYELQLYGFARQLHGEQVEALRSARGGDKYFEPFSSA